MGRKLLAAGLVTVLVGGCATMKGKPAPDFELKDLDGGTVRLSSFRGKPILLTFWAAG